MQDRSACGGMIGELVEYGGDCPSTVYRHDPAADAGAEFEDSGEHLLLSLPVGAEFGTAVKADLANVVDSWQQLGEQRQLPGTLVSELGVKAECCSDSGGIFGQGGSARPSRRSRGYGEHVEPVGDALA